MTPLLLLQQLLRQSTGFSFQPIERHVQRRHLCVEGGLPFLHEVFFRLGKTVGIGVVLEMVQGGGHALPCHPKHALYAVHNALEPSLIHQNNGAIEIMLNTQSLQRGPERINSTLCRQDDTHGIVALRHINLHADKRTKQPHSGEGAVLAEQAKKRALLGDVNPPLNNTPTHRIPLRHGQVCADQRGEVGE